jgi:methionine-rich copper-binding protein CopC
MPLSFRTLTAVGRPRWLSLCLAIVTALVVLVPPVPDLAPTAAAAPTSIWSGSVTPGTVTDPDTAAVELGVKFRADTNGFITGLRFYKGPNNTGTHVGHLWTATGTLLATATFTGETASGWQQVTLASPVAISANTTYVASYYAPVGRYSVDDNYFAAGGVDNPPLHALASGVAGGNGVYRYGTGGGFPTSTFAASNYWVDVVFDTGAADTTPPTVTSRSPAPGATGVAASANLTATFNEPVQPASISFTLTGPGGTPVPAAVGYDAASRTATLNPSADLTASTSYTATVSGARDTAGNQLPAPVSWSFTTAAGPGACPCTIWPGSTTPATPAAADDSAVEVGVRFRADSDGFITGLRFYKGAGNTGTHVGHLWSNAGTLLASATFTNESASGWQQVTLASPVAVTANTTYVASYHAPNGRYAFNANYFATGVDNPPLHALEDGADGANGVYRYGASGFPTSTFNSANYWVDVVFNQTAADTAPPAVIGRSPAPNATGVAVSANVTATFNEPVQAGSIRFELRRPDNSLVPAAVTYDAATRTATLNPDTDLGFSTSYTATVSDATDPAGNRMTTPVTWSFATGTPPPPPPDQGPGGPILAVGAPSNPFGRYTAEILRAEGLNEFATADIGSVSATTLSAYDVVILGDISLTAAQVTMFTDWVNAGGNLIALRPRSQLAGLLGLAPAGTTLSDAYLRVDTATGPGVGITDQTIQFHGAADRYTLAGATAVATLYSNATTATANPAVTLRSVGTSGGQAAAFTYDLARSIVYTRQGNPAWAGQERDGQAPIRSDDLFFGGSSADWVNLNKVAIPQADEQQRLLANLIQHMNRDRKPLPRFWYFPRNAKAVVVATGDDHGNGGTAGRFDQYRANSPAGCVVADWECLRFGSYVYTGTPLSNAQAAAYHADGFELGLHVSTGCANYTPTSLESAYATQLAEWTQKYASVPAPSTNRTHCIVWSDWSTQADVENRHGIRLDTNYYYWPPNWVSDRPGFFTGSGMPMRFATMSGAMLDVYQAATQMTDESGQSYPFTPNTLLDRALGPLGYYGAFTANLHTDSASTFENDQVIASARARGVPVVSGRQMLTWLDGRNGSSFGSIGWSANSLRFTVSVGTGANGLTAMVPTVAAAGSLTTLTRDGSPVSFTRQTVKGLEYAVFQAAPGSYTASYAPDGGAPAVSQLTDVTQDNGTAAVTWATSEATDTKVVYGSEPDALSRQVTDAAPATSHDVDLRGLRARATYYYRVQSRDSAGNVTVSPPPGAPPASFTTPARDTTPPPVSSVAALPLPDGTAAVTWRTAEPADARVEYGSSPQSLTQARQDATVGTGHHVVLTDLAPGATYYYRVVSRDTAGNVTKSAPRRLEAAPAGVVDTTVAQFRQGTGQAASSATDQGDGELTLSASRLPAGGSTIRYTSRLLDARAMVTWDRALWQAEVPAGATIRVSARAGSTSRPDGSWTPFRPLSGSGASLEKALGSSRYLQYRVEMTAGDPTRTPRLDAIGFTHKGGTAPPDHPGEG